ncbi:gap junction beta-2 protein-like [Eucyclogobius newberryi]|uniref:gap junction beta-2 protein-like n=1 Tax=Eucyclogobius newberryi TaxID=166745 RepID=UPI003B5C252F
MAEVGSSVSEVIFISVNQSITMMGKAWLIVMLFLRVFLLLLAGFPLYQDEQERFVCNTIQPGCANVCYDIFSPISLFRFWLVQLITLCLPITMFIIYVVHKVTNALQVDHKTYELDMQQLNTKFITAYFLHLLFRMLLEAGFGAAHYYLFGFYIPRRFLCQNPPCTTQVDCYISRPTEKTVMLNFMLGVGAFSIFLNVLDFFCAVKRSVKHNTKKKVFVERIYEEDCIISNSSKTKEPNATEVEHFRKRHGSKGSRGGDPAAKFHSESRPCSPGIPASNTNGNNGYSANQEDVLERQGSDVALCPPGTPRSIRVSKRGRLKPPPPPRRDLPGDAPAPLLDGSNRGNHRTLVELKTGSDAQPNDEEKRSEWV